MEQHYIQILDNLKEKIRQARQRIAYTANTQFLGVYWEIGHTISVQMSEQGWGAKVVDRLARDLKAGFPDMTGLSPRNLRYMRSFAEAYPLFLQPLAAKLENGTSVIDYLSETTDYQNNKFLQASLAKLTWYHHITLLDKVKNLDDRAFYIHKTIENGWSRDVMTYQIASQLHKRQGQAITNFDQTLPKPQSDLAREMLKNPYLLDFISANEEMQEKELEKALIDHIRKFLLELGRGFAYVGNQYRLQVEKDEFFLDLLFYNFHIHAFTVFELKVGEFKPEYAGKLNFYVNAVDAQLKGAGDNPTIGVLLCKTPNETVVRYTLQGISSPMGVADYQLPQQLKSELPSIEELEEAMESEAKNFNAKQVKSKPSD
ncbi:Predicted nuclease of restriction endonuclease-like (RecB) superfamily, DUF1016 family [bacterium A37T11]|nr:Predicted nuclease of restriction endonuclease-like (RecB) superfamily, DUF1016 family [bacterium A37T11]